MSLSNRYENPFQYNEEFKNPISFPSSLEGDFGCEYCGATFNTCGELAVHIAVDHPNAIFPNCCNSDLDCQTMYGPNYVCKNGVCVEVTGTYPMVIGAEHILEGEPSVSIQVPFTLDGVTKTTPYAENLEAATYHIVFPQTIIIDTITYTLLGDNDFNITHPQNAETYFKASYFSYLPPPPIRVRFNATDNNLVDWGEGPQEYGSKLVDPGSNVEVRAIAISGYKFTFWRKNDVKSATRNPAIFQITEDETKIDAIFIKEGFNLLQYWPLLLLGGGLILYMVMKRPTIILTGGKQ